MRLMPCSHGLAFLFVFLRRILIAFKAIWQYLSYSAQTCLIVDLCNYFLHAVYDSSVIFLCWMLSRFSSFLLQVRDGVDGRIVRHPITLECNIELYGFDLSVKYELFENDSCCPSPYSRKKKKEKKTAPNCKFGSITDARKGKPNSGMVRPLGSEHSGFRTI